MATACIYPGPHSDQMSVEHYLPAGLGRFGNYEPLRDKLCTACNNRIGRETEEQFLRAGPISFFRQICGVLSRDGSLPPSPFYRGAGGAPPIYTVGRFPDRDYDILWEVNWGSLQVSPLRQIVFEHPIAGRKAIPILDRMLREPEYLAEYLRRERLENARPFECFAIEAEIATLSNLIRGLGYSGDVTWIDIEAPEGTTIELVTTVTITTAYLRAIAKIVFHYALSVFQDLTGKEREFDEIRNFIFYDSNLREAEKYVIELHRQFIANFQQMRPINWSHFLAIERSYKSFVGFAQFFAGPECLPFPYKVMLGRSPDRARTRRERKAHQFMIGEPEGRMVDLEAANHIFPVLLS